MKLTVFLTILAYLWSITDSALTGNDILEQLKATYKPVGDADLDRLQLRKSHAPIRPLSKWKNPCWFSEEKFLCVPYFYVMGFRKCATTDLYARLSLHPEVVQPWRKETYWLTERRKVRPMEDYADWFGGRLYLKSVDDPAKFVIGDGDPNVVWHFLSQGAHPPRTTPVPQLLKRLAPKADFRFIVLMRDPAERVYSDYLYSDLPGKSNQRFHQEVMSRVNFYQSCFRRKSVRDCVYDEPVTFTGDDKSGVYLGHSLYIAYLHDWLVHYPRHQVMLIETEHYSRNMSQTLASVINFLGLDPLDNRTLTRMASLAKVNRNTHREVYGNILSSTKRLLDKFFQPFNEALAKVWTDAGKDSWLQKSMEEAKEARREEAAEKNGKEEAKMEKILKKATVVADKEKVYEKKPIWSSHDFPGEETTDVSEDLSSESKMSTSIINDDDDSNEHTAKVVYTGEEQKVDAISEEKPTGFDLQKEMQVTGLEKVATKYVISNPHQDSHIPVENKIVLGGKERKHVSVDDSAKDTLKSSSNAANSDPFVITNIAVDPKDANKSLQPKIVSKLSSLENAVEKAIENAEKTEKLLAEAVQAQENNVKKNNSPSRYVGTKNGKPIGLSLEKGKPVIVQLSDPVNTDTKPVATDTKSVVPDAKKPEVSQVAAMETDNVDTVVMETKEAESTANNLPITAENSLSRYQGTKKEKEVVNVSFKNVDIDVVNSGAKDVTNIASSVAMETDKMKSVVVETGENVPVAMETTKTEADAMPTNKAEIPTERVHNQFPPKSKVAIPMATRSEKSAALETKSGNVVHSSVVMDTNKMADNVVQTIPRPEYNHFERQAQIETNLAKFIDVPEKPDDKSVMNKVLKEIKLTESTEKDYVIPVDENGKPLPLKVKTNQKSKEFNHIDSQARTGKPLSANIDIISAKSDTVVEKADDLSEHDLSVGRMLADPAVEVEGVVMKNTWITKFKRPRRR